MADKLILNANMICKSSGFRPQKCTVEKVIEVSGTEFQHFIEAPTLRNYYLPQYKKLMGFYDDTYHGVLFVNEENGDGLLVNSEGADYARYSQYIPNAREIIRQHEQTASMSELAEHLASWVSGCISDAENSQNFNIPFEEFLRAPDTKEALCKCFCEALKSYPEIESAEENNNIIFVARKELTELKIYCPLKIEIDDGNGYTEEVCSENYAGYDNEINDFIRDDLNSDENAVERGLAAYLHDENLDKKVYSITPMVETRGGNLYGVAVVQSYGELDKAETADLIGYISGQFSDGFGEGLEQRPIKLGEDEVYISLWNSDDYYLKLESELFHDQKLEQTMGGLS